MPGAAATDQRRPRKIGRREFLRSAGAATVGTLVTGSLPRLASGDTGSPVTLRKVFRLSTHGRDACGACKGHGANRYFRRRSFANEHRAHLGCNCVVVKQYIRLRRGERFFLRPSGTLRKQWDVRWPKK